MDIISLHLLESLLYRQEVHVLFKDKLMPPLHYIKPRAILLFIMITPLHHHQQMLLDASFPVNYWCHNHTPYTHAWVANAGNENRRGGLLTGCSSVLLWAAEHAVTHHAPPFNCSTTESSAWKFWSQEKRVERKRKIKKCSAQTL